MFEKIDTPIAKAKFLWHWHLYQHHRPMHKIEKFLHGFHVKSITLCRIHYDNMTFAKYIISQMTCHVWLFAVIVKSTIYKTVSSF